ncbi:hypothetical protein PENSUB_11902 [Penicillium subrubescens]|uniref:Uncharacterized protein n=1 Tax=Penicillium subrubescens TaxID=1316194 RepID=A0A1Q5T057_9EURO|nr:hypothetical protein PENSUB_11902 [Penicillium subrubescens]
MARYSQTQRTNHVRASTARQECAVPPIAPIPSAAQTPMAGRRTSVSQMDFV